MLYPFTGWVHAPALFKTVVEMFAGKRKNRRAEEKGEREERVENGSLKIADRF